MQLSSAHAKTERALAAIVLTDAVSFSARMSIDEESTLALIQRDLALIAEQCEHYGGKVLKSTGDGLLMSFYSAVQAVLCSQEIQKQLGKLAEGLSTEDYLQHRIGIHLGDVLFSHGDVLGNGVNIAARLQTRSVPGGICISQTVYDVVKARMDISATYLGSLKLKNIQEPVIAYQIPPFGQSATMVMAPTKAGTQNGMKSPLAIAAQALEQNPQIRRIKKLIFGTYQGVWENDLKVLAQFDLLLLLEKLHQRYHTLIALEKALQGMAARLNHQEIYLAVTDIILKELEPVYYQAEESTAAHEQSAIAQMRAQYREIAQELFQQADRLRIKKLLYAVIHSVWENNPTKLALHTLEDLVAEVHAMAPAEADLSYHLERIIRRLNRQDRYTQLALIISEAFHCLYRTPTRAIVVPSTSMLEVSDGGQTIMTNPLALSEEEGLTSLTQWQSLEAATEQTRAKPSSKGCEPSLAQSGCGTRDRADLFNLRLEIMRYTNPLRAKILLLSMVRSPFTATSQDWLTLKSKSLDELIQETFQYCKTFADLESKLTIMCHCVDNVSENVQTVGAILQAMKPFYSSEQ